MAARYLFLLNNSIKQSNELIQQFEQVIKDIQMANVVKDSEIDELKQMVETNEKEIEDTELDNLLTEISPCDGNFYEIITSDNEDEYSFLDHYLDFFLEKENCQNTFYLSQLENYKYEDKEAVKSTLKHTQDREFEVDKSKNVEEYFHRNFQSADVSCTQMMSGEGINIKIPPKAREKYNILKEKQVNISVASTSAIKAPRKLSKLKQTSIIAHIRKHDKRKRDSLSKYRIPKH